MTLRNVGVIAVLGAASLGATLRTVWYGVSPASANGPTVRGSSVTERPRSAKLLRGRAPDDWLLAAADELSEFRKKICPFRRARNEDVAFVRFVALAAQIAQRTKPVQGACHDGLRDIENMG